MEEGRRKLSGFQEAGPVTRFPTGHSLVPCRPLPFLLASLQAPLYTDILHTAVEGEVLFNLKLQYVTLQLQIFP